MPNLEVSMKEEFERLKNVLGCSDKDLSRLEQLFKDLSTEKTLARLIAFAEEVSLTANVEERYGVDNWRRLIIENYIREHLRVRFPLMISGDLITKQIIILQEICSARDFASMFAGEGNRIFRKSLAGGLKGRLGHDESKFLVSDGDLKAGY
jgi:hypothetical protein